MSPDRVKSADIRRRLDEIDARFKAGLSLADSQVAWLISQLYQAVDQVSGSTDRRKSQQSLDADQSRS